MTHKIHKITTKKQYIKRFPIYISIILLVFSCNKSQENSSQNIEDTLQKPVRNAIDTHTRDTLEPKSPAIIPTASPDREKTSLDKKKPPLKPRKLIPKTVNPGADFLVSEKLNMLEGKRVAVATNHTALLTDGSHLVDILLSTGITLVKVFTPEHGFRGDADAGEKVSSSKDSQTGLPLISLYGNNKKPTQSQLSDIDVVVFDIQDVGTRHYTYISTLTYLMEACAENGKEIIVADRPNPNGWYVDGPMMEAAYTSFIGMHKIPIVHGMTIGEYAQMVNEEGWLKAGKKCKLTVLPCSGYNHKMRWAKTGLAWTSPSPNLGTEYAAYLYPILCWYEATNVSVGRGTDIAFTITGAPWFKEFPLLQEKRESYGLKWEEYTFTPISMPGKSKTPPFMNEKCKGLRFKNETDGKSLFLAGITLLQQYYQAHQQSGYTKPFFISGLEKWAGNTRFQQQITSGVSPEAIYDTWQKENAPFRTLRKKYLLYSE